MSRPTQWCNSCRRGTEKKGRSTTHNERHGTKCSCRPWAHASVGTLGTLCRRESRSSRLSQTERRTNTTETAHASVVDGTARANNAIHNARHRGNEEESTCFVAFTLPAGKLRRLTFLPESRSRGFQDGTTWDAACPSGRTHRSLRLCTPRRHSFRNTLRSGLETMTETYRARWAAVCAWRRATQSHRWH